MERKTIAVDLDKTLAFYHSGMGLRVVGKPIGPMIKRVRNWLAEGHKVVIFTARAGARGARPVIRQWLRRHGLPELEITNIKSPEFTEIWDDRAVQVGANTGEPVTYWTSRFA